MYLIALAFLNEASPSTLVIIYVGIGVVSFIILLFIACCIRCCCRRPKIRHRVETVHEMTEV